MILDIILASGLIALSVSYLVIYYRALVINKTGQTTVDVNRYGEGWPEVVLFVGFIVAGLLRLFGLIISLQK